jgi:hypothetical protein
VSDLNNPPPIDKFLPPPPDEVASVGFNVIGNILEMPLRAVQGIAGSAQEALTQVKSLPKR